MSAIRETYREMLDEIKELATNGLLTDGAHHKQWFLEAILRTAGVDLEILLEGLLEDGYDWEPGIAP